MKHMPIGFVTTGWPTTDVPAQWIKPVQYMMASIEKAVALDQRDVPVQRAQHHDDELRAVIPKFSSVPNLPQIIYPFPMQAICDVLQFCQQLTWREGLGISVFELGILFEMEHCKIPSHTKWGCECPGKNVSKSRERGPFSRCFGQLIAAAEQIWGHPLVPPVRTSSYLSTYGHMSNIAGFAHRPETLWENELSAVIERHFESCYVQRPFKRLRLPTSPQSIGLERLDVQRVPTADFRKWCIVNTCVGTANPQRKHHELNELGVCSWCAEIAPAGFCKARTWLMAFPRSPGSS